MRIFVPIRRTSKSSDLDDRYATPAWLELVTLYAHESWGLRNFSTNDLHGDPSYPQKKNAGKRQNAGTRFGCCSRDNVHVVVKIFGTISRTYSKDTEHSALKNSDTVFHTVVS